MLPLPPLAPRGEGHAVEEILELQVAGLRNHWPAGLMLCGI